jgi:hypothetical protein
MFGSQECRTKESLDGKHAIQKSFHSLFELNNEKGNEVVCDAHTRAHTNKYKLQAQIFFLFSFFQLFLNPNIALKVVASSPSPKIKVSSLTNPNMCFM